MTRWLRRLVIAIIVIPLVYFAVGGLMTAGAIWYLLTPGKVDWSRAEGPAVTDPLTLGYQGDPRKALDLPFEPVALKTQLGDAPAWFVRSADSAPPDVMAIYVHGIGGLRENGYRQVAILHEAGISTLMMSYRNDEDAPPAAQNLYSFGLTEWPDLESAVDWELARGARRVLLVADSMGAGLVGQFLAHSYRRTAITALALDAPALDFRAVVDGGLARYLPFHALVSSIGLAVADTVLPVKLSEAVVFDTIRDFPGPIFLVHGLNDQLVPFRLSQRLFSERDGPIAYLRTEADHLMSYRDSPARYHNDFIAFLRDKVLARP
jgi:fermentation-respiration switch protein FrsA (DUF1100 family)